MDEFSLASHILALLNEQGRTITNLNLNIIVPHIIGSVMASNPKLQQQYLNQPCYLWRYGPIYPKLYEKYSIYGPTPILDPGQSSNDWAKYDSLIMAWLHRKTFAMIDDNHRNPFWQQNYSKLSKGTSQISYPINALS